MYPTGRNFNFYNQSEQGYLNLLGGNGNTDAADPLNLASWPNYTVAEYLTQSTRTASFGGGSGGGLDDRFDHQITSDDLLDGEGLSYIGPTSTGLGGLEHSYQSFGNDGVSYNTNINNTYTGRSQSAAVLDALYYFSDHLPVVADYQVPAWMDVTVDPVPTEVNLGDSIDLDVLVENIADVVGVYGADELDYTLTVSGDLVGGATGTDAALGGGQTYQVSLDTSSVGTKNGTITVSSSSRRLRTACSPSRSVSMSCSRSTAQTSTRTVTSTAQTWTTGSSVSLSAPGLWGTVMPITTATPTPAT